MSNRKKKEAPETPISNTDETNSNDLSKELDWKDFASEKLDFDEDLLIDDIDVGYDIFFFYDTLKEHDVYGVVTEEGLYKAQLCISITGETVSCDHDLRELKLGDIVFVTLLPNEKSSFYFFIEPRRRRQTAWKLISQSMDENKELEVFVKEKTKDGYNVLLYGMLAFLPNDEVDTNLYPNPDSLIGNVIKILVTRASSSYEGIIVTTKYARQ